MKNFLKSLAVGVVTLLISYSIAQAAVFIVPQGGSGAATFPVGACLKGNGTSAFTSGACDSSTGFWTRFNTSGIRPATSTDQVLIGATATTSTAKLEVIGNGYISGNVGIGTAAPGAKLEVVGDILVGTDATGGALEGNSVFTQGDLDIKPFDDQPASLLGINFDGNASSGTYNINFNWFGFVGDPRRAFRFVDSNTGIERMRIEPFTGNVGIGTTSPWGLLSVTNTTASPSFVVEDSTSPDTTPFIIDQAGNVGIGTAVAADPLVVLGANDTTPILTLSNSVGSADYYFTRSNATGALSIQGSQAGANNIILAPTSGNVGIGTTSPYAMLAVAGQAVFNNITVTSTTATSTIAGPLDLGSTGTSPTVGNATLVVGTITVTTGAATSNSFVILTRKTSGGTIGTAITYTITNGSFTINSDNPLDTSVFTWLVIN